MTLEISASGDIEQDPSAPHSWFSTGNDPYFSLKYGFTRPPFLVIRLKSNEALAPKLYINKGRGFVEEDALIFQTAGGLAIVVDIGRVGLIKAIRCDPIDRPCKFTFQAAIFAHRHEAMEFALEWKSLCGGSFLISDVVHVPRFRLTLPRLRRRKQNDIKGYLDAMYALAKSATTDKPENGTWLSIITPVFNAPERHLKELVGSFTSQEVSGVELVLSDDASSSSETLAFYETLPKHLNIKVVRNHVNGGIAKATNAGLSCATGRWVGFLDHDDVIAPNSLKMICNVLSKNRDAEFLYTDEVIVDDNLKPLGLMLKPGYDPVLLSGMNYINHFSLFRRERLASIGFLREGFDGSQDYDTLLRYLEAVPRHAVYHFPYPAYWWRRTRGSYSQRFIDNATKAARNALIESFARKGLAVEVKPALTDSLHRVDLSYSKDSDWPKVSIVIPSKNGFELIERVLNGLYERTDYPNFEVIIVDNGTTDAKVLALYEDYKSSKNHFHVELRNEDFNFSRSVNYGLNLATGDCVLLLNNDVEVRQQSWLRELVSCLRYEDVGIVGAKLCYPNDTLQHAGVIAGLGGLAGHWFLHKPENFGGPMNRLHLRNTMSCVTGAVMLISKRCLDAVGRFDAKNFAIAYNDVDFCLRARKAGFQTVWTPFSSLYHHESLSRGSDSHGPNRHRFKIEQDNLRRIHMTDRFEDPALNQGYSKMHSVPFLVIPRKVPDATGGF